jgi:hypothetical protein
MASAGIGTGQHLAGEMFKMMAGVDMTHVPYRSAGPALTDLISGQLSRRRRCGWCKAAALPLPACGERACPGLDPGSASEASRVRGVSRTPCLPAIPLTRIVSLALDDPTSPRKRTASGGRGGAAAPPRANTMRKCADSAAVWRATVPPQLTKV